MTALPLRKSIGRSLLRRSFFLPSLTLVLVCFGFSPDAPGATFAPTEKERVAATKQGFKGELKLAVLPQKIDPDGQTYVQVDDMLFRVREDADPESAFIGNRWTNGIVYYVFDAAVSSTNQQIWRDGAAAWSAVAPLTFIEGTGIGNYIYVQNGSLNNSYVGMIGGQQVMNILNWNVYSIAHEIGHALGLMHEHQRSDRDSYVTINYSYVQSGYAGNFYIAASTTYGGYDFDSIMHYSKCIFSTDCSPSFICACTHYTITVPPPNAQWQDLIGQLTHLSQLDGAGMAQRYARPALFSGEVPLGNGIYYLQFPNGTPFGYYSYLTDQSFIYHFDMGYEYWFDANDGHNGIYFYDFMSNHFFYTSPSFPFPYLYDFSLNSVLYYYPDSHNPGHYTTNPRYFYNFATGQIITM